MQPLGGSGQMTAPANYPPTGVFGAKSSCYTAGALSSYLPLCAVNFYVRACLWAGSTNQEAQRRDAHWKSIVLHTQVNIHPSRCYGIASDHDSFAKTLKLQLEQDTFTFLGEDERLLLFSCLSTFFNSPSPLPPPSSQLECKDNLTLFLIPPSPFLSFEYVPTFLFIYFFCIIQIRESHNLTTKAVSSNSNQRRQTSAHAYGD